MAGEIPGGNGWTLVCPEHQGLSSNYVLGTGIKQLLRGCLQPPAESDGQRGQTTHTGSLAWSCCGLELSGTTELGLGQGWPLPTPPSRSGCMHIRSHSCNQVSAWKMNPGLLGQWFLGDRQHPGRGSAMAVGFVPSAWPCSWQAGAISLPYTLHAVTFGSPPCRPRGEQDQARLRCDFSRRQH